MENYNHPHEMKETTSAQRGGGFITYVTSSILATDHHHHPHNPVGRNATTSYESCFQLPPHPHEAGAGAVKSEASNTNTNTNTNNNSNNNTTLSPHHHTQQQYMTRFHYPMPPAASFLSPADAGDNIGNSNNNNNNSSSNSGGLEVESLKAKIISHPQYSHLLEAYLDCQKVGAPPEVAARLAAAQQEFEARQRASLAAAARVDGSKDPELDQFMEAYYDMLVKYREELTRPVQEAMDFMRRIEAQLNVLSDGRSRVLSNDDKSEGVGSSEEDQENSGGEAELSEIDPQAEDRELKNHLLKKYSGYLSSLKQELSKKKKKGKLPKEARQKLLSWWELHYKWPYPSESEKVALAEATGLDQKQINNWFINQRKRHWKPSEDMQFMVMDGIHPQNAAALYMDGHYMGDGPYRFGT